MRQEQALRHSQFTVPCQEQFLSKINLYWLSKDVSDNDADSKPTHAYGRTINMLKPLIYSA